jgi:hypothetical protein
VRDDHGTIMARGSMETRFDGLWSLAFIAGDPTKTGERHLGNAVALITGPKVQGGNSEWYWRATG